jgi:hypothetical protein
LSHNNVGKTLPHPLLQPDKPKKPARTKNRAQKINRKNACAYKVPTTTTKRNLNGKKGKLVESIIPKPPIQQQPTLKKAGYFNNNQTNAKLVPK